MTNEWNEQNQSAADAAYAPQPVPGTHTASEAQSASGAPSASSVRSASGAQPTSSAQSVPGAQPSPNAAQPVSGAAQSIPEVVPAPAPAAPAPAVQSSAAPQQAAAAQPVPAAAQPSATPALICGILAIVLCFIPVVPIVLGAIAIVLAGKYFRAGGTQGTGKAGRICGIIGIVASIVMMIINIMLVIGGLMIATTYDAASSSYSASSSASSYSAPSSSEQEDITDAAAAQLDKIKNRDPETMQQIADMIQTSFDDSAVYLSGSITLEKLDVDPMAMAEKLVEDFDYEPFYTSTSGSDEAEADFDVTYLRVYDIATEFETLIDEFVDSSDYDAITSEDQAYKKMGELLMTAIDNTKPDNDGFATLEMKRVNGEWVVDEDSWEDELDYFFAFS